MVCVSQSPALLFCRQRRVRIWDTVGEERFHHVTFNGLYKRVDGFMVVYDMTDPASYFDINEYWMKNINSYAPDAQKIIVANKSDQPFLRVTSSHATYAHAHVRPSLVMNDRLLPVRCATGVSLCRRYQGALARPWRASTTLPIGRRPQ
jgi:GTPase SAR1 family protein